MRRRRAFDDPDLPILAEVRERFLDELEAALGPRRGAGSPTVRRRVARRVATIGAVLALVGASAVAEQAVLGGRDEPETSPTVLGAQTTGGEHWKLLAYRHRGDVCWALLVAGTATSACADPVEPDGLRAGGVLTPAHRFAAGVAGARVAAVRIAVGGETVRVATRAVPGTAAVARAELPRMRWFVATLPARDVAAATPARLVPEDAHGRALSAGELDCTYGQRTPACRRLQRDRSGR